MRNLLPRYVNLHAVTTTAPAPEQPPEDGELLAKAAAGEREAFVAIYRRYHGGIYRFARSMTGSTAIAEDVTQEVFLALMRDITRYDPERAPLGTYLYAIARNVTRYRLRKERRFVVLDVGAVDEPRASDDPEQAMMRSQTVKKVRAYIMGLSSRYREVLILCDLNGLSYEEASAILNTRIGTVRSRLHRARKQLAERIARADGPWKAHQRKGRKCLT
jgi:RNA polymerase sigma-70 factor (ECF subfamily)